MIITTCTSLCDFISSINSVTLRKVMEHVIVFYSGIRKLVQCVLNELNKCASTAELLQIQFEPNYLVK